MSEEIVQELQGFSGAKIYIVKNNSNLMVRKIGSIDRNHTQLEYLYNKGYLVPKIIFKNDQLLEMEYIPGIGISQYLLINSAENLLQFLISTFNNFKKNSIPKNYEDVFNNNLSEIDCSLLPFTKEELFDRLPKHLYQSDYHGDFTFENLIYSNTGNFYMIDVSAGPYNSYIFDIAKLRQDLEGHWFLRNTEVKIPGQLKYINDELMKIFPEAFDNYLYILMLLRIYRNCKSGTLEHKFITKEIYKIWKL